MSTKEVILARLATGPQSKDDLLVDFTEAAALRGAASVLSYLVRSGQAAVGDDGQYSATGAAPTKLPKQKPPPVAETPAEEEEPIEVPVALDMAIWSTGEPTLRRDEAVIVMQPNEVAEMISWLRGVNVIREAE